MDQWRQQKGMRHAIVAVLVVATVWIAIIAAVHRESPRTLVSFHGLLHASIADGFAEETRDSFPPENPFFAGEPLCYYWFYQFLAGQLVRIFDLNVFHALEAIIMLAVVGLTVAAVALGCRLYRSALAGCAIAFLVACGTNPLGVLFAGTKVARDGIERLQDDPNYLWGVVHPLFGLIRFNDIGGLYGPMLNFFLNITSRPVALAALLATTLALHGMLSRPRWLLGVLLLFSAALTTALSPVLGLSAVFALSVGLVLSSWITRADRVESEGVPGKRVIVSAVCMILGSLAAFPTYNHLIFGPSASDMRIWIVTSEGLKHAITVGLSVLPLLALAVLGWRKVAVRCRPFLLSLVLAGTVLLAITVLIALPAWNQSNCFHAAVVLLAVPAGACILRAERDDTDPKVSRGRSLGLLAVFLPTTLLLVGSYVHRPRVAVSFDGRRLSRTPADSDLASLYAWVRSQTRSDAIFVLNPDPPHVRVCGNASEFPAMTGRAIFTEELRHYLVAPYPDASLRVELAKKLSIGGSTTASEFEYLSKLGRPIYLLSFEADDSALTNRLQSEHGAAVFGLSNIAVHRVRTADQTPT